MGHLLSAVLVVTLAACDGGETTSQSDASPSSETLGFVLSRYHLTNAPQSEAACPEGFNLNDEQFGEKLGEPPYNDCDKPAEATAEAALPFFTLDGPGTIAGMNLDAVLSERSAGGACAHDDFTSPSGQRGIDNQLWRLVGCIRGFQQGDLIEAGGESYIKDGSRTILIEVRGVDDRRNDPEVRVRIFSSTDTAPKDAAGSILGGGSLGVHADSRYHSGPTAGTIEDGVLRAGPVDLHIQMKVQTVDSEYYLRDSILELELADDGTARGLLAGYWDAANFYGIYGRHRLARSGAHFLGFMCPGVYRAAYLQADGHPDPETGTCTSLSTAFEIEAVPAFVIHPLESDDAGLGG